MKRSTLFTTVAALALSTAVAAAQSSSTQPSTTEKKQTETTQPSTTTRTNSDSSSPSAQQQNTQTQPSQRNTNSASQPSTSQSSPSQGAQTQQQNQPAAPQRSTQGQQSQQPSTSQTQNQPAQTNQQQTQSPAQNNQRSTQGTQQQPSTNQAAQPSGQQSGQAAAATTPQQRTQITAAIQQQNVSPVRVNFAVNVGVAVPTSVRLAPLPATIVSIVPAYRGYSYFVTEERIVIVEPRTKKIVEILPMEGRAAAAPARKQQFTSEQRTSIKKHATSKRSETTGSARRVTVEETIPADVELEEFSDVVVREVPTVRSYRYIRRDNDVIVVDPGSRRVIEVID